MITQTVPRLSLLILLAEALHCCWILEQPSGSSDTIPFHPRLDWIANQVLYVPCQLYISKHVLICIFVTDTVAISYLAFRQLPPRYTVRISGCSCGEHFARKERPAGHATATSSRNLHGPQSSIRSIVWFNWVLFRIWVHWPKKSKRSVHWRQPVGLSIDKHIWHNRFIICPRFLWRWTRAKTVQGIAITSWKPAIVLDVYDMQ